MALAAEAATKTPRVESETRDHFDTTEEKQSSKDEEPEARGR